jgi:tetratricopeptide (TPR) repeat protein
MLLGAGLGLAPAAPSHADAVEKESRAAKEKRKRSQHAVGEWAYKKLSESHELLADEKWAEALALMNEMSQRKRLNPHEQALMWQTYAYIQSSQQKYKQATESFEKCLALDALPEAAALNTQYNLGQLYMSIERYDTAAKTLEDWLSKVENPAGSAYYLLAMAHVQNEDFARALPHARSAVARAKEPVESWLQLLLSLEFELKHYRKVADILEVLVTHFPSKTYYLQLSAIYNELDREKRSLAVLELAYVQDLLDRESELLNLAQLYLFHDVPYRAAHVLEKGLGEKRIDDEADNWELLGNAWLQAREYDRVIAPLGRAAKLSEDGDIYLRLAQVHMERDEFSEALAALENAFAKGGLEEPGRAYLLLGITHSGAKRYSSARKAFNQAQKYEKSRKEARQWIGHVEWQEAIH